MPDTARPPVASYISKIPNETLLNILEYLDDDQFRPMRVVSWRPRPAKRHSLASLLRVCRRWKAMVEVLLYRKICVDLDHEPVHPSWPSPQVLQNLEREPRLFSFVRQFELQFSGTSEDNDELCSRVIWILQALSGHVKGLRLRHEYDSQIDRSIFLQTALMCVENLDLYGSWGALLFEDLLRYGDGESLRTLKLVNFSGDCYGLNYKERTPYAKYVLPEDRQFSASLQTLDIFACDLHVDALQSLLHWPAGLKDFRLQGISHQTYSSSYSTHTIQRLLNLQSLSLETIVLGTFSIETSTSSALARIPSLAKFHCLRRVHVHSFNLFQDDPITSSRKLASPALEFLTIDTNLREDYEEIATGRFDSQDANWLMEFARYHKVNYPESKLKDIQVICDWANTAFYSTEEWPDMRLVSTRPVLAEVGIHLSWSQLYWSDEEWKQMMEARNKLFESGQEEDNTRWLEVEERSWDGTGDGWDSDDSESEPWLYVADYKGQQRICRWACIRQSEGWTPLNCSQHIEALSGKEIKRGRHPWIPNAL